MPNDSPLPVPRVPPLPAANVPSRRQIIPAWAAVVVLLLLLGYVLFQNFQRDQRPQSQRSSNLIQKEQTAVAETKTAYSAVYDHRKVSAAVAASEEIGKGVQPAPPVGNSSGKAVARPPSLRSSSGNEVTAPPSPHGSTGKGSTPPSVRGSRQAPARRAPESSSSDRIVDDAIDDWRSITRSDPSRAGAWRRLGITLFLFNRPGGLDVFRRIPHLPPAKPIPVSKTAMPRRLRERMARLDTSTLPVAEEAALWEALYGPAPIRQADVPALRAKLSRLNLGWFEDIAAVQLYDRAGMRAEADRAGEQAHRSADSILALLIVEGILRVFGTLLLVGGALVWAVRRMSGSDGARARRAVAGPPLPIEHFYTPPDKVPEFVAAPNALPSTVPVSIPKATPTFSYRARMIAFVVYFGSYLLIAWPLQFLSPVIVNWSDEAALRFMMLIDLLAYIPVTALTLIVLKKVAEAEQRRVLTWRETLSAVGFRTDGVARDAFTAILAYAMLVPVLLFASQISDVLFRHFHTPVHPIDLVILHTQDGVTRTLLLIQAAVGAPIVEEFTFRGLLFEGLRDRWGLWIAAALSAAVFALSHNTLPGGFLQLWTLGFVFALVSRRNRSILPNILMHGMHNGLITMIMFAVFSK